MRPENRIRSNRRGQTEAAGQIDSVWEYQSSGREGPDPSSSEPWAPQSFWLKTRERSESHLREGRCQQGLGAGSLQGGCHLRENRCQQLLGAESLQGGAEAANGPWN